MTTKPRLTEAEPLRHLVEELIAQGCSISDLYYRIVDQAVVDLDLLAGIISKAGYLREAA